MEILPLALGVDQRDRLDPIVSDRATGEDLTALGLGLTVRYSGVGVGVNSAGRASNSLLS